MTTAGLIPDELRQNIQRGDCILFFGADQPLRYPGAPLSRPELAQKLAGRYGLTAGKNWSETAQNYLNLYPKDRHGLIAFLLEHNSGPHLKPGPIHEAIAASRFRAIVSAWYNEVLERTLQDAGFRVSQVIRDKQIPFATQGEQEVIVVKLYGSLRDPESIVCGTWDEDELLGQLSRKLELVNYFWTIRPPLFVGFDLLQAMPRRLYLMAAKDIADVMRRTYAVWPDDLAPLQAHWQHKNIEFRQAEAADFLQALAAQLPTPMSSQEPKGIRVNRAPYKFLDYYNTNDADIFCGRETERLIVTRLALTPPRLLTLFGPSGSGKTSLLLAGVVPSLQAEGYQYVYVRPLDDPLVALRKAVAERAGWTDWHTGPDLHAFLTAVLGPQDRLIMILDQFEELFLHVGSQVRERFFAEVAAVIEAPPGEVRFLLSLREDYLAHLDEARPYLPNILGHSYRLKRLDRSRARVAITEPAGRAGTTVEADLVDQLVGTEGRTSSNGDLVEANGQVPPAVLQIVMNHLYQNALPAGHSVNEPPPVGLTITLDAYQAITYQRFRDDRLDTLRGAEAILATYVSQALALLPTLKQADGSILGADPQLARELLKVMVTSQATKAALTQTDMESWLEATGLIRPVDEIDRQRLLHTRQGLEQLRLLRGFERDAAPYYELAHDYLAAEIGSWLNEEDKQARLVQELLRRALDNWEQAELCVQPDLLDLIQEQETALYHLAEAELKLLFRSALAAGKDPLLWFERAKEKGIDVSIIAREGLVSESFRTRASAAEVLAQLGKSFANDLIKLLSDLYPQVRVAAIHALEHLLPNLGWQQHLLYECYVPAGSFVMGDDRFESDTRPAHEVYVRSFYCGKHPVTNAEYSRYMADIGRSWEFPRDKEQHPVTNVRWYDARDYASWANMRLLTEAEWEKSATWRTRERLPGRKCRFPWGNEFELGSCNTKENGPGDTSPIGSYSPRGDSPFGATDMAGNVWEWTSTQYKGYPYDPVDGREDPIGRQPRVMRGGSFSSGKRFARGVSRNSNDPDNMYGNGGFRCGVVSQ